MAGVCELLVRRPITGVVLSGGQWLVCFGISSSALRHGELSPSNYLVDIIIIIIIVIH